VSPPKFSIYLHSVFQFGFALSCTLTWSCRPHEVSVRNLAGLGENEADDEYLFEPSSGKQVVCQLNDSFAGFLPTAGYLPAVALASY